MLSRSQRVATVVSLRRRQGTRCSGVDKGQAEALGYVRTDEPDRPPWKWGAAYQGEDSTARPRCRTARPLQTCLPVRPWPRTLHTTDPKWIANLTANVTGKKNSIEDWAKCS